MRLELRGAGYTWPSGGAVGPVSLAVRAGERVLVTGRSGCGKSTLVRLAAGLLHRQGGGRPSGEVRVDGVPPRAGQVGFVGQDPGDQLVTGSVADEIAFGPEAAGWDVARIEARIDELRVRVGLDVPRDRDPRALSGGQQQRLVVAAALAAGASLLLLDEPLAQLDAEGAAALLDHLAQRAAEGVAVVLVEHRLEVALAWAERVVVLEEGRIAVDLPRSELGASHLEGLGLRVPFAPPPPRRLAPPPTPPGPVVVSVVNASWAFGDVVALDRVTVEVRGGERVALLGVNGSGKSTLIGALSGRLGRSDATGRRVEVPQDPDLSLFSADVAAELAYGPGELGLEPPSQDLIAAFGLRGLLDRPPQALSRGQRLRVAVAAALVCRPALLLLDEPTAGQDHGAVLAMMDALQATLGASALVFATHDVELALRRATRICVLVAGRLVFDGPPEALVDGDLAHVPLPPVARWCRSNGVPWAEVR